MLAKCRSISLCHRTLNNYIFCIGKSPFSVLKSNQRDGIRIEKIIVPGSENKHRRGQKTNARAYTHVLPKENPDQQTQNSPQPNNQWQPPRLFFFEY